MSDASPILRITSVPGINHWSDNVAEELFTQQNRVLIYIEDEVTIYSTPHH